MRIFIRTLTQHKYSIDVAPTDTILHVKQKLTAAGCDIVPEEQKLLYQHRVLTNCALVSECKLVKDAMLFVVNCIFDKPK